MFTFYVTSMQGAWSSSANSKLFKLRVENSEPFSNFGSFPILCWRVGTFQNSVHATKQLLHKASQCGSYFCTFRSQILKFLFKRKKSEHCYFCTFRSQTLKFLFKKKSYEHWDCCPLSLSESRQSLSSMSLLEFVKIWQHCHKVTKSLNHLSLWMLMHLYYLCVHLCICLCLLVVWSVFGSLGNLDICCFWLFILQKKTFIFLLWHVSNPEPMIACIIAKCFIV